MSNKDVEDNTSIESNHFARGLLERLRVPPNPFDPFQGRRPSIHQDELELNQRMEAAFPFLQDPTTSAEEVSKRSDDAMGTLGEGARKIFTQPQMHQAELVTKSSAIRPLQSVKLPIIKPPVEFTMGPLDPLPTIDYSTANAKTEHKIVNTSPKS